MKNYSRRDFLKLVGLGMGAMAFRPFYGVHEMPSSKPELDSLVRVATQSISVYSQPDDQSTILYTRYRDELINTYDEFNAEKGPDWNPVWYKVWRGYIHSPRLQKVKYRLNPIPAQIQGDKQLGEISVPYTQSMGYNSMRGWHPVYRLYYESVHWVVGIEEGPDKQPWARIKDELFDIDATDYFVPASHIRLIPESELTPISPNVDYSKKRIEVSIYHQRMKAFEDEKVVLDTKISTGINYDPPDPKQITWRTPTGSFTVNVKMPSKHMGDGSITSDLEAYELPGVPWVCFFAEHGVAFHGTYWHNNFGVQMSHGCVNMRMDEAKWLYRWVKPVSNEPDWDHKGLGTRVKVT